MDIIPKIFHRTWVNQTIPAIWADSYEECKNLYDDWQIMFWTDERSRRFISEYYSSFLSVYDSYEYPIQRADAIRYFVLYHYGGVYMDLDIGCSSKSTSSSTPSYSLDDILKFPAVVPKTDPIGYSNDFMASRPRHPFFKTLIMNLQEWNHWYMFPYLTVFFSTGPMFLNFQVWWWRESGLESVWVLDPQLYSDGPAKIFNHLRGSTWHEWDAKLIKFIYSVYLESSLLKAIILVCILGALFGFAYRRVAFLQSRNLSNPESSHVRREKVRGDVDKFV
jgi:mannosyltransferase OCH1-like enzyme